MLGLQSEEQHAATDEMKPDQEAHAELVTVKPLALRAPDDGEEQETGVLGNTASAAACTSPLFSMIMCNFNKAAFVEEAIESVLKQTFTRWELIIVDDASTDDSVERITDYLGDPRIRLYRNRRNRGCAATLEFGLTQLRSELIGILDSDDALAPGAIEAAFKVYSEQPQVGVVLSQVFWCDSKLQPLLVSTNTPRHLKEPLIWMRTGHTHLRSFRKEAYARSSGLDPALKSGEDWDLLLKLEEVANVYRINEPLYYYRLLPDSLSRQAINRTIGDLTFARSLYSSYLRRRKTRAPNIPREVLLSYVIAAVRYSRDLAEPVQSILWALRAMRIAPLQSATYRALVLAVGALTPFKQKNQHLRGRYYPPRVFQSNTGNREPDRVVCVPLLHKEGHCLFGHDYIVESAGLYRANFEIDTDPCAVAEDPVMILDAYENQVSKTVLAERQISQGEALQSSILDLSFSAEEGHRIELRCYWHGQCTIRVMGVVLSQLSDVEDCLGGT